MFKSGPFALACIFCCSGVLQPTIVQFLTLSGAFDKSTLLIVVPNYIGMSFAVLTRYDVVHTTLQFVVWLDMLLLAVIDIVSQGLCLIGLVYAGPSIYIIVYSSTTIWAAVWSYLLLNKALMWRQWVGIVTVVMGLSITAYDSKTTTATSSSGKADALIGIVLILLGSFTHALTWVLIEKWTKLKQQPEPHTALSSSDSKGAHRGGVAAPELVCSLMGVFGCVVYSAWQVLYTAPRWQQLVLAPIADKGGNVSHICAAFSLLAFMGFLHAVSFYHLLGHVGSVATGVMKGVQSVAVLLLSHEVFCSIEATQCFTRSKGVSLVVVLWGVFYYTAHTRKHGGCQVDQPPAAGGRSHDYDPIPDDCSEAGHLHDHRAPRRTTETEAFVEIAEFPL
jgi:drug/metabolite transporter (DMT)-like permease